MDLRQQHRVQHVAPVRPVIGDQVRVEHRGGHRQPVADGEQRVVHVGVAVLHDGGRAAWAKKALGRPTSKIWMSTPFRRITKGGGKPPPPTAESGRRSELSMRKNFVNSRGIAAAG